MGKFDGKVALVTGGASGIGLATAERLCAEGAQVVVADVDEASGKAAASKLGGRFVRLDVAVPADWERAIQETRSACGGLDLAYLNAGVTTRPVVELDDQGDLVRGSQTFDMATLTDSEYRRIMGVNVDGVVFGLRACVPAIAERGGGAIAATASVAGLIGFPPDPIYTLTKHAVVGLVRAVAPTLAEQDIRLNAICPGGVDTNIFGSAEVGKKLREVGTRLMPPSHVADAVVQSIESGETGQAYVVLQDRDHQRYAFAPIDFSVES